MKNFKLEIEDLNCVRKLVFFREIKVYFILVVFSLDIFVKFMLLNMRLGVEFCLFFIEI